MSIETTEFFLQKTRIKSPDGGTEELILQEVKGNLNLQMPKQVSETQTAAVESIELVSGSAQVVMGANLLTSILLARVIQFLWGIINSLQLIVLTVLYNLNMPDLCFKMLVEIMKLTNLDLIDVEPVLVMIFGEFHETDPFNEKFGNAGYDSTNFILECGPLFLLILIFLVWAPIRKLTQKIAKLCK